MHSASSSSLSKQVTAMLSWMPKRTIVQAHLVLHGVNGEGCINASLSAGVPACYDNSIAYWTDVLTGQELCCTVLADCPICRTACISASSACSLLKLIPTCLLADIDIAVLLGCTWAAKNSTPDGLVHQPSMV